MGDEGYPFYLAAQRAERAIRDRFEIERGWDEETRPGSGSFRRYIWARKVS